MNEWVSMLIGGIAGGGLLTAVLTRKSQKEQNETDNNKELWDRTYKLITNLENQVATFKQLYASEKEENEDLKRIIEEMETELAELRDKLETYKKNVKRSEK